MAEKTILIQNLEPFYVEILTCSHYMHNFGHGQTTYLSQTYPFQHDPSITLCSTLAALVGTSTGQGVCNAYLLTFIVFFLFTDSLGTPQNIFLIILIRLT